MTYHTKLGITDFYIYYDSNDRRAITVLQLITHVTLTLIHPEMRYCYH